CLGVPGLDQPAVSKSGWLDDARGRIEGDFRGRLVIQDLAREYGLRADSVGRAFKRAFGIGIPTLIRKLRVSWCMMEIADGGDLSAVAISAGYADQSHMTRAFQQELGISPGEIARRP
ncbi:MAG: helix-turn-helix domain-containing protein, partial [Gemmatimonadota bacterium]